MPAQESPIHQIFVLVLLHYIENLKIKANLFVKYFQISTSSGPPWDLKG